MKLLNLTIVVTGLLCASFVMTTECDAQGRRGGGMRAGFGAPQEVSEMSLLAIEKVRQHLMEEFGLAEDAVKKISEAANEVRDELNEERRAAMQDFRNMSDDERTEVMDEMRKMTKDLNAEAYNGVKSLLSKEQRKRLGELKIQRMGNEVLHDGMIQTVLGLNKEQATKLTTLKESYTESRQKLMTDLRSKMQGGGDREAMMEAMTEMRETMTGLREDLEKNTMEVLSEDQQKKLNELKGKAFEFPQRQGRRGRGA